MKLTTLTFTLFLLAAGSSQAGEFRPRKMTPSAWEIVTAADGIKVGEGSGSEPSIQVIFDVNCPYCAKLYRSLQKHRPGTPVRWVPIAYFKPDSERIASAILESDNPAESLKDNFDNYDFQTEHGGYNTKRHASKRFSQRQVDLQHHWLKWGGMTPMIIFRNADGKVYLTAGANQEVIQAVFDGAVHALPSYTGVVKESR